MADDREVDYSAYDGLDAVALVRALDTIQQRKDALEEQLKLVNREYDHLRITRIPDAFDAQGIESLVVEGVGRCSLTADLHASIAAGQKDNAFTWLRDSGRADLITETVNAGTLKAVLRKALNEGEDVPQGLFNVTPFTRASITRRGVK